MKRGLTMVELLLALSLLSVIMLAVASWTQVTANAAASMAGPVRWRAASEAVFQLIHDDLVSGDFGGGAPRVDVVDGVFRVTTRATGFSDLVGAVTHRYRHRADSRELLLEERVSDGRRRTRVLLDDVSEWRCEIDPEERLLTVMLASGDDLEATRSYPLP